MIRTIFIRPWRRCRRASRLQRSTQAVMLILGVAFSCQAYASKENSRPLSMNIQNMNPDESDEMEKIFKDHPQKFTEEIIAAYRAKKIIVGMDPYIASRVGGQFQYRVDADPSIWPAATDPIRVIYGQARHPDASKIWMVFENETQFPEAGRTRFLVVVEHGMVITVQKVDSGYRLN